MYPKETEFSELLGKTLTSIEGMAKGSSEIIFTTNDGSKFKLTHWQDCCEHVEVEDVIGDVSDLLNSPITLAEESTSGDDPSDYRADPDAWRDSYTWTFYRLATAKGHVDVRWLGESNGYYSESVDFEMVV